MRRIGSSAAASALAFVITPPPPPPPAAAASCASERYVDVGGPFIHTLSSITGLEMTRMPNASWLLAHSKARCAATRAGSTPARPWPPACAIMRP